MSLEQHRPQAEVAARLHEAIATLTASALRRLDAEAHWYRELSAQERSWLSVVAQYGIQSFLNWYDDPSAPVGSRDIFGAAPPELARSISLQQTLELIRVVVDVVESEAVGLVPEDLRDDLRLAALRYSREIAFSAAHIYARAAESRGAWDARLEATVVDSLLRGVRDPSLLSRTSALGWRGQGHVVGVVAATGTPVPGGLGAPGTPGAPGTLGAPGTAGAPGTPGTASSPGAATREPPRTADLRRVAGRAGADLLLGVQGDRLVLVLGAPTAQAAREAVALVVDRLGPGPVATGPEVPDVADAGRSLRAALAALHAVAAWPGAPRPVRADDLLPERVLNGDPAARHTLLTEIHQPLVRAGSPLIATVDAYLDVGGSLEGAARRLFVHTNTVRYRLRRVTELIGWDPTDPREGYVIRTALAVGRLTDGVPGTPGA